MLDDLFNFDFIVEEDTSIEEGLMDDYKKKRQEKKKREEEERYKKKYPIEPKISRKQAITKCNNSVKKILLDSKYKQFKKCVSKIRDEDLKEYHDIEDFLSGKSNYVDLWHINGWDGYDNLRNEEIYKIYDKLCIEFEKDISKDLSSYGYHVNLSGGDWDGTYLALYVGATPIKESVMEDDNVIYMDDFFMESMFDDTFILEADDEENDDNFDMDDDGNPAQPEDNGGDPGFTTPEPPVGDNPAAPVNADEDTGEGEAPDDNFDMPDEEEPAPQNDTPTDTPDTGGEAPAPEEGGTNTPDDNFDLPDDGEEGGDNPAPEGGEAPDDNFDLPENGEGGEDTGGDGTDTGTEDGTATTDGDTGEDPHQKLKDLEKEIFDNLAQDQKISKINELKDLYTTLYNRCDSIGNRVLDIPKDEETTKLYDFVSNNLNQLKKYIYDYLTNSFDNRTYIENLTMFQKYLAVMDSINGILEEIKQSKVPE